MLQHRRSWADRHFVILFLLVATTWLASCTRDPMSPLHVFPEDVFVFTTEPVTRDRMVHSSTTGRVFVAQGRTVLVPDLETRQVSARIEVDAAPSAMAELPDGAIVCIVGSKLQLIDPNAMTIIGTADLPHAPAFMDVDLAGRVYLCDESGGVSVYSTQSGAGPVVREISVGNGVRTTGLIRGGRWMVVTKVGNTQDMRLHEFEFGLEELVLVRTRTLEGHLYSNVAIDPVAHRLYNGRRRYDLDTLQPDVVRSQYTPRGKLIFDHERDRYVGRASEGFWVGRLSDMHWIASVDTPTRYRLEQTHDPDVGRGRLIDSVVDDQGRQIYGIVEWGFSSARSVGLFRYALDELP